MHKDLSRSRNIGMRVLSFVTGMSVTVSGFCVSNLGAAEQISLQAPQSGNTMLDYEFEDDSLIVARELPEPGSDLEGYTFL